MRETLTRIKTIDLILQMSSMNVEMLCVAFVISVLKATGGRRITQMSVRLRGACGRNTLRFQVSQLIILIDHTLDMIEFTM